MIPTFAASWSTKPKILGLVCEITNTTFELIDLYISGLVQLGVERALRFFLSPDSEKEFFFLEDARENKCVMVLHQGGEVVEEVLIDFSKVGNVFEIPNYKFWIERSKKEKNRIDLCLVDQ